MTHERKVTLIALFRQISRLMVDDLVARMQRTGYADCTPAHHAVFELIDPGGTRLTVLAERTGMSAPVDGRTGRNHGATRIRPAHNRPVRRQGSPRHAHPSRAAAGATRDE